MEKFIFSLSTNETDIFQLTCKVNVITSTSEVDEVVVERERERRVKFSMEKENVVKIEKNEKREKTKI
jgi:hypothetical protein